MSVKLIAMLTNNDKTEYEYGSTISTSQIVAKGMWASGLQAPKQIMNNELVINNGNPVIATRTGSIEIPVVYTDTVTGKTITKTAIANVKGAVIYGNGIIMSEDASQNVYKNNVNITWNTGEKATIVHLETNTVIERENQPITLNMKGTFEITVGKIVRRFTIEQLTLDAITWDKDSRTITINDRAAITEATISCELESGVVFEGDLFDYIGNVSSYTFSETGYYLIRISDANGTRTIEINDDF